MTSSSVLSLSNGGEYFDWLKYMEDRPEYSKSFYDLIWDYHKSHSNHWTLAHDVGTGPGCVADELHPRFEKVIAADPNTSYTTLAEKRFSGENVTVKQCRAEDLATVIGPEGHGNVDLITLGQCVDLMDTEQAFSGFAKLLRPGGTLAIWMYGRPIFAEKGQKKSQEIYNQIATNAYLKISPIKGTVWQHRCTVSAAWLDNIGFPSEDWTDVQRTKWNHDKPMSFVPEELYDFEIKYKDSVGPDEKVEKRIDRDFWARKWCTVYWVKRFMEAQFPWSTDNEVNVHLTPIDKDLEKAMGGKGAKTKICWPAVLILATRK